MQEAQENEANLSEAAGPNLRLTHFKECKSVLANPLEEDSLKFHAAVPGYHNVVNHVRSEWLRLKKIMGSLATA